MAGPSEKRPRKFYWLLQVGVFLAVLLGVRACQQRGVVEGQAPEFALKDIHGHNVSLADYRGRPLLLHFWASWCSICRLEQGSISAIARDWPVLTVAMQSGNDEAVKRYLAAQGDAFSAIADEDGELAARYGARAVPATFVLDGDGRIRFVEVGYTTNWGLRARLWWAAAEFFP